MNFDPMSGTTKPAKSGLPTKGGDTGITNAGGVTVSAMSTGLVKIVDDTGKGGWELDPFLACDIGQRLLAMGIFQIQQRMLAYEGGQVESKPRIDIVRGTLPPGVKI
jgi:hypothetical protein